MTDKNVTIMPMGENLWIERDKVEEARSPGGLVLPKQHIVQPDTAKVLAVGDDVSDKINVGDTIILSRFAGTDVTIGIDTHTIINLRDVLGIVK